MNAVSQKYCPHLIGDKTGDKLAHVEKVEWDEPEIWTQICLTWKSTRFLRVSHYDGHLSAQTNNKSQDNAEESGRSYLPRSFYSGLGFWNVRENLFHEAIM